MMWGRAVSIVNAAGAAGAGGAAPTEEARGIASLRFTSRIVAIDAPPKRGDTVIDAQGSWILPGLVNAHDHLELNHYGRLKFRDRYENATEWIADMRPRLGTDAAIRRAQGHPLTERLFIGALKNVLAGVTTVAHHNPYYSELRRTMPIRVVRRYGWAHSFALAREPAGARGEPGGDVVQRWSRTSADAPFFVHIAEGVDEEAARELSRLDGLGCLTPNTVVVHGVAIDAGGLRRIVDAGAGLVWCPGSNVFLFGRTAAIRLLLDVVHGARGRPCPVALGSDSRLTGSNDLLDELRVARDTRCASPSELVEMVTTNPARLLRLRHAGRLAVGDPADFIVVPKSGGDAAAALLAAARRDLELVVVGGRPLVASAPFVDVFHARSAVARPLTVDGVSKLGESGLVRRIAGCPIVEPGVSVG